jgi:hypothetical protein
VPAESGKPSENERKLPERGDALNIDLPFDEAIKAALAVKPPVGKKRPKASDRESA